MNVSIHNQIITQDEASTIFKWAITLQKKGYLKNNTNNKRNFRKVSQLPNTPSLYYEIRNRITDALGIEDILEPVLESYISVITEGGAVHAHTDPEQPGYKHLRANVMISKPKEGGRPIIEGETYDIEQRGWWWFLPGEMLHTSEKVTGKKPRIICSYGYLVDENKIDSLLNK